MKRCLLISLLLISLIFNIGCSKIDSLIESNSDTSDKDSTDTSSESSSTDDIVLDNEVKENNSFWEKDILDDTAIVIVNDITEEEKNTLENVENVVLDNGGEQIVAVAARDNLTIEIWSLQCDSDNKLVEKELLHKRRNMKRNEAINIKALIPEGMPSYKIKGSCDQGSFEYEIAYNGKTGGEHLEYISYEGSNDNNLAEDNSVKTVNSRLFFFNSNELKEYYVDKDIEVEGKAVIKALTKELQNAAEYNSNFLNLSEEVEITSAKVEDGVLKVVFSSDYTESLNLGSATESGLVQAIVDTYGYNLKVNKVAIYFKDKLYTGVKGELAEGYFKVDFSAAEELE